MTEKEERDTGGARRSERKVVDAKRERRFGLGGVGLILIWVGFFFIRVELLLNEYAMSYARCQ